MTGAGLPRLATDSPNGRLWAQPAALSGSDALVLLDDRLTPVSEVVDAYHAAVEELQALKRDRRRVSRKLRAETELRPWQVELLKLQRHLEKHRMRMIVLFEGRDAAGKGGTIRRVTRYMNEKHYRVVALG
nr:hypothetical protein GCM10020092_064000 [Actinoplanes digitatis]